ncbi:hypothetical protein HY640_03905 [Candidatus Woesearchaeota archaeon]|nr:hypothetical protein [Candidatus Woesearchaeota archaeon]
MISTQDQEDLFRLIADYLGEDVECLAIGGTAMMFRGYKNSTKDIDMVFMNRKDRATFIRAIEKLGYSEKSIRTVFEGKRGKTGNKPLIYSRGEDRFDLFVKDVFGFQVEFGRFTQRHDYIGKNELTVFTAPVELLMMLKSVTDREKDYEDMETIVRAEKNIDWAGIVEEAIRQKRKNKWIIIDLEEKMKRLSKTTFIRKEIFERLYKAEG